MGSALCVAAIAVLALYYIPSRVIHADRYPITRTPGEVGLVYEDVVLRPADEAIALQAWWMPATAPDALLIFVHGGGSNRHSSFFKALEFYREMVSRNVSVLAFDLRNHGASDASAPGLQFGRGESEDLRAAVTWAREREPELPLFAMGISMGGGVVVHGGAEDERLRGLILLDPLLDTESAFVNSVEATSGIPSFLLWPSAWSAIAFFGLPGDGERSLDVGRSISRPTLLIQDPDDPVVVASHAAELAAANPNVELWLAPPAAPNDPEIAWRGGWGSHVSAFALAPEATLERIMTFLRGAR